MYSLFVSTLLTFSAFGITSPSTDLPPSTSSFHTPDGVTVMHLEYTKKGSEVYITVHLQVDESILSVTSASHSYVEATEQLNQVIAAATNK
ncbi:hypothetical protein QWY85_11305 [Neolewinella lacunae]|uniref:Uncharacterized protein n=1 Tax=Neolewinella lacunae TaxID=1517758 RepID=A0A923PLA2_9BACT|nr:hypothetical protein [Neolewinella lacunae]MBC6993751.1 hypothetical protein [Neolewinella lacunae]MDN3635248.1 hypothetical protein [Neolewinella lacunae]